VPEREAFGNYSNKEGISLVGNQVKLAKDCRKIQARVWKLSYNKY